MSDDDELVETLVGLGRGAAPDPDPAFANRLDADLRTLHMDLSSTGTRPPSRSVRAMTLAGLACVVVIGFAALLLTRDESPVVVMTAAAATEVVLPGEEAAPGMAGQRLPDGARIVVSPEGEAVAGGVVLGPGSEAIVVGGRIEVLAGGGSGETGAVTTAAPSPSDEAGRPTSVQTSGPVTDRPGDSGSTPTRPTSPEPTDGSTSTPVTDRPTTAPSSTRAGDQVSSTSTTARSPSSSATTGPDSTTTTGRPTTTTTEAPPDPSIDLTAQARGADRVVLDWTLTGADHPDAWRIEAVGGDRVVTLAVLRDGTARTTTVARIDARGVRFRVVAMGAEGTDLLSSRTVDQPGAQ